MTEREEIIKNAGLNNIEKGNLLQKQKYFDDAIKFYDAEILRFHEREEKFEEIRKRNEEIDRGLVESNEVVVIDGLADIDVKISPHYENVNDYLPDTIDVTEAFFQKYIVYEKMGRMKDAINGWHLLIHKFSLSETDSFGALVFAQKLRLEKKINESLQVLEGLLWDYENELMDNFINDYDAFFRRAILIKLLILEQRKDYKNMVNVLISVNVENLKEESLWELLKPLN